MCGIVGYAGKRSAQDVLLDGLEKLEYRGYDSAGVALAQEGGIPARSRRYTENNRLLIEKMRAMGFATYIDGSHQGPIITTFFYPAGVSFRFEEFYRYIKERGYAIYPGKLTEMDTFRIGNIGEIYPEDIDKLTGIIAAFLKERKEQIA